ncbi:MAG TPA: hypothetical protein VHC21_04655 [Candidatus Saccharimonadales bacterium]|nr:hypothetical protein [Candidatus Saccharimonadales bacterium]
MSERKSTQLNCFSPPVMIATMVIEMCLAIYSAWRYKMSDVTRLAVVMLLGLATFQLSEYFVCTGIGSMAVPWSRVGFVAITALPPLGLHLTHVLAGRPKRRLVYASYVTMIGFMAFFLLAPGIFTGHKCNGNYVIFQFSADVTGAYSVYYFGWLAAGIGLGCHWANRLKAQGAKEYRRLQSVRGIVAGYLVFLVPSGLSMTVRPDFRRAVPSVLCGFAIFLALIVALYILPRAAELRRPALTKARN